MRNRRAALGVLAVLGWTLIAGPASGQASDGQARAAVRKLGHEGVEAYQAEQYGVASEKLEKAYAMLHIPTLGLWSARVLVKQDKLLEAVDRYLETTRLTVSGGDVAVQERAQADARTESEATQALIPSVVIHVDGAAPADVTLRVDGSSVSSQLIGEEMPLNPGAHRIEASLGTEVVVSEVTLQRKQKQQVLLKLKGSAVAPAGAAAPTSALVEAPLGDAPPHHARRTVAWVALGGGAAGLLVGGIAGALAAAKRSSLDKDGACVDHRCPQSSESAVSNYNSLRTISTVGFVAGGVLGATGVVLLLTQPHSNESKSASLWLSPGRLELRGQF